MGSSLKDQLLKTGVANKQQAHDVDNERRKKRKQKSGGAAHDTDAVKEHARRLQVEKAAHDRELNRQRNEQLERKAVAAQIRQLIEANRMPRENGETAYSFVDAAIVRKIYVTDEIAGELGRGLLSIVRFSDRYEVVPAAVAGKISERDASVVVAHGQPAPPSDEDDPYADYQVPDDLMW